VVADYAALVPEQDKDRFETKGEVPLLGEDRKVYVRLEDLTLRDLPAILHTIVVLEEDYWSDYLRRESEADQSVKPPSARNGRGYEPKSGANARNWANGSDTQVAPARRSRAQITPRMGLET
jgi:hypothetical protein